MLLNLKKWFSRLSTNNPAKSDRKKSAKSILLTELTTCRLDGKRITHRRLDSLAAMAGTSRFKTKKLLKEIGARPSSQRSGKQLWTLDP